MNISNIELAPFDNLLVYKKGYTPEIIAQIIASKKLSGLRIFSVLKEDRLESLDFLQECAFLQNLDITSAVDYDFSFLKELINLKKLSINVEGGNEIDLSNLKNLNYLSLKWRKKVKGLEGCIKLSSLCIIEFKEQDLVRLHTLKSLNEIRVKTASIETLKGLEGLVNLQSLSIGYCKKLTSIKAINQLPKLRHFDVDTCPNIKDYESVSSLPSLENLSLINCGRVESIRFIEGYPLLSKLSLLGNTVVNDGNLLPAKSIKSVEYKHQNHYNIKLENLGYDDTIKSNLNKIKNLFK